MRLLWALVRHALAAITFRHDGTGLPRAHNRVYWLLCTYYVACSVVLGSAEHFNPIIDALASAVLIFLLHFISRPSSLSGFILVSATMHLVKAGLVWIGADIEETNLHLVLLGWELIALVVMMRVIVRAEKALP